MEAVPARRLRAIGNAAVVVAPPVLLVFVLAVAVSGERLGFDFRLAYLPAAEDVLRGLAPYAAPGDPALAGQHAYVYPPLLAYLVTPFTLLAEVPATVVALVLLAAGTGGALWLVGVRDWRCYGAACAWAPVFDGLHVVTATLLLPPLLAAAWRWRARPLAGGLALGAGIALKLLLAPLLFWAFAARRGRLALWGAAAAALLVLAPWALLSFAGLTGYPSLLRSLASLERDASHSAAGALVAAGLPPVAASAVCLVGSAAVLVVAWREGRRGHEERSFALAIAAVLLLSPILWLHYLTLLLVPLAVARPTLSAAWLAPAVLWIGWLGRRDDTLRAASVVLVVACVALVVREAWRVRPA